MSSQPEEEERNEEKRQQQLDACRSFQFISFHCVLIANSSCIMKRTEILALAVNIKFERVNCGLFGLMPLLKRASRCCNVILLQLVRAAVTRARHSTLLSCSLRFIKRVGVWSNKSFSSATANPQCHSFFSRSLDSLMD